MVRADNAGGSSRGDRGGGPGGRRWWGWGRSPSLQGAPPALIHWADRLAIAPGDYDPRPVGGLVV